MTRTQLATTFRKSRVIRSDEPLTDADIRQVAPSVFASAPHGSRSSQYAYIPTAKVLAGLRREGFQPVMACQARTRAPGREPFTKHLIRLRHASQTVAEEANEVVLVNSHDGSSSYQMLAGRFRFVCGNGLIMGDTVEDLRVPHRGDVVGQVIEGAYRVLKDFERVDASREAMRALPVLPEERLAFAEAAIRLRWESAEAAPVTPAQVLTPRRFADTAQNLWTTFNVVQENLVRGGLRGQTRRGKRTITRPVEGIDTHVALNRALWTLAEAMRKLKSA